jgi:E3 ubiquitin-protein ligase RGLG
VTASLREDGLESCNLIIAVDFTLSNLTQGMRTFNGQSLHSIDPTGQVQNPYQNVIDILGRTLESFDEDRLIPVFGFGDVTTGSQRCFPFLPESQSCHTFQHVLRRYSEIAPHLQMSGPTSFAPVIHKVCMGLPDSWCR